MVVCRYYQQGNCRFGGNCKYEHIGTQSARNAGLASQNRFGAFQNPASAVRKDGKKDVLWAINATDVQTDLTAGKGRPQWILSTYGPGKNAPASLLDGNELSFEELRLRFYDLRAEGNEMQATSEAAGLWSKAEQQMAQVLSNVAKVVPFMEEAENKHPNRIDFLKMTGTVSKEQFVREAGSSNPSGGVSGVESSRLGALGAEFKSAFSTPSNAAFGQAVSQVSAPSKGVFGQPTPLSGFGAQSFGQSSKPTFGQSSFGQPSTTPAFGKPAVGAFGQPSAPAQPSQTLGFGTSVPNQPAAKTPFAASSMATFGQPSKPVSAFGQPSQPASGFAQQSQLGGIGQSSVPSSGFGQPSQLGSVFGQPTKPARGFGTPSQPSAVFGQPSQPTSSSFGAPTNPFTNFARSSQPVADIGHSTQKNHSFGQPAQLTPAFGQLSQPTSTFGQPSQPASGFGQPSKSNTADQAIPASGQPLTNSLTDRKPSNPFGGKTSSAKALSQPSPLLQSVGDSPNPFTAPSSTTPTLANNSTQPSFAAPTATATATASTSTPHPLTSKPPVPTHYTQTLPPGPTVFNPQNTKRLTTYKSRPVTYIHDSPCYERTDGKGWERIWFPDGPENVRLEDVQLPDERYTEEVREAYKNLAETGHFEVGRMPEVAPRREWVGFDF